MPSADAQSCTVSAFDEEDIVEINALIDKIPLYTTKDYTPAHANNPLYDSTLFPMEKDVDKFVLITNFYQEQPHLMDPHLQGWIDKLLAIGMSSEMSVNSVSFAFRYLYLLSKVRGQKYMVRLFPHEVSDIERVLVLLEDTERAESWHSKFILLLWLSILCLIPFDLTRLDGDNEAGYSVKRMLNLAKKSLEGVDKSSEAASMVVAKLVTRPDLHEVYLEPNIDWLLQNAHIPENKTKNFMGTGTVMGCLKTLAQIYKLGRREYLVLHSPKVLEKLSSLQLGTNQNTLLRKFEIKLYQRIGLSFLVTRVAAWRYSRGSRILTDTFGKSGEDEDKEQKEEKEEEYDIPDQIEEVLENLLRGLQDPETIVRWSAAKGVGRITARLPGGLASDIVSSLLECFGPLETNYSWHGGCLALAELGRHGLLLPVHLQDVVPILVKALKYDEKRGNYTVGSNIRDAACYMCWSFARAYDPYQIKPYVHDIATALILTTLFDREVSCRRAASAAFQENVGRQGSFEHGIDILTACDYYSVGLRQHTYLNLSVVVAGYEPYTRPIIDFLVQNRVKHWDPVIRKQAAAALRLLCVRDPHYMTITIIPQLLEGIEVGDSNHRHGALHALGDVLFGLKENKQLQSVDALYSISIQNVVTLLENKKCFRGTGGDAMRAATCYFIQRASQAGVALTTEVLAQWQAQLNLCLVNPEQDVGVQGAAVDALRCFSAEYYRPDNMTSLWENMVTQYTADLEHEFTATRVGAALALGVLPGDLLRPHLAQLVASISPCTTVRNKGEVSLAECRASAVGALTHVVIATNAEGNHRMEVYDILLKCLEDYSTDSRGDIGSYVREAALLALQQLNAHVISRGATIDFNKKVVSKMDQMYVSLTLTANLRERLVCSMLQQSVEKIDRTRQVAGRALRHLVHCGAELEHHGQLKLALPVKQGETDDEYFSMSKVFPRVMPLIQCPVYASSLLKGLVVSIGGLTESLVKSSSGAFIDYLTPNVEGQEACVRALVDVMKGAERVERVISPLLKTVDLLLVNIVLDPAVGNEFCQGFLAQLKVELRKCGSVSKLLACVSPLSNCLQFSDCTTAYNLIMILLCHRYPRVRKGMADAFYTALLTYDDVLSPVLGEAVVQEVMEVIENTVWDSPEDMNALKAERNKLCVLLDLKVPLAIAGVAKVVTPQPVEEFDSYKDLVNRAGY